MPWKSKAQAAYMHIHHPEIAKKWDEHTPAGTKFPEHVKGSKYAKHHKAGEKVASLDGYFAKIAELIFGKTLG